MFQREPETIGDLIPTITFWKWCMTVYMLCTSLFEINYYALKTVQSI